MRASNWIKLFGNLCQVGAARSFATSTAIDRMDALQMTMSKGKQFENLEFQTLDQFENDYFKIMTQGHNYGWYQTQFYFKAQELHSQFGRDGNAARTGTHDNVIKKQFGAQS